MENENNDTGGLLNEPKAAMGNASNPTADESATPAGPQGLLDQRADKYIREVAPIEDVPDDEDQQDIERIIREESEE
jgi:hypothetical protein